MYLNIPVIVILIINAMKKILLLSFLMLSFVFSSHAQDKKMTIGFGPSIMFDEFPILPFIFDDHNPTVYLGLYSNTYVLYNFNDKISAGFEYNINIPIDNFWDQYYGLFFTSAFSAKFRCTFGSGIPRFFLGIGTGMYQFIYLRKKNVANTFETNIISRNVTYSIIPELGVKINNFQISTSWHFTGDDIFFGAMIIQTGVGWNFGVINKN